MNRKEMISAIISHKDNLREDELKHHGIQGQKWGVRRYQNVDGSLTPEGREHYGYGEPLDKKEAKSLAKNMKNMSSEEIRNRLRKSFGEEAVDRINTNYDRITENNIKAEKLFDNMTDDDLSNCAAQAALLYNKPDGGPWLDPMSGNRSDATMKDISRVLFGYTCDDYDQGRTNAYNVYLKQQGTFDKNFNLINESNSLSEENKQIISDQVENALGKYKNYPAQVSNLFINGRKLQYAKSAAKMAIDKLDRSDSLFDLSYESNFAADWDPKIKDSDLANTKKIIGAIGITASGWYQIMQACENLGMNDFKYADMTESDWKRLGKEMNRLANN